jgi:phospholipid/cholesterol/gamma-HCH transport system permease protein
VGIIENTGNFAFGLVETAGRGTLLFVETLRQFKRLPRNFNKFIDQMFICGVSAIPVVTITALFSGMVIAAQTGNELKKFGLADLTLGPIVGGSMTREMGPVLTAICVAGFVGGGMASLIATMRVNEEIDALEVMSINPVTFLIMPRLAAMMLAMPLLTVYADFVGILGGALVSRYQVGVTFFIYFDNMRWALAIRDVVFGLIKAWAFGVIITMIACDQGYHAFGGAEGVGRATMRSVVYAFLGILIANYILFSLVYLPIFTHVWN